MGSGRIHMPSFPTPRPLRFSLTSPARKTSLYDVTKPAMSSGDRLKPKLLHNLVSQERLGDIVSRLTRPTLSTKLKSSRLHPKVNYVDMDYYQWSRMALYADYQRQIYSSTGTVKDTFRRSGGHHVRRPTVKCSLYV